MSGMTLFLLGLVVGIVLMTVPFFLVVYVCVVRFSREMMHKDGPHNGAIVWPGQWQRNA